MEVHEVGESGDLNVYAYVSGQALKSTDPLGLCGNEGAGGACQGANAGTDTQSGQSESEAARQAAYNKDFSAGYAAQYENQWLEYQAYNLTAPRLVQVRMEEGMSQAEATAWAQSWAERHVAANAQHVGDSSAAQAGAAQAKNDFKVVPFVGGMLDKASTAGQYAHVAVATTRGTNIQTRRAVAKPAPRQQSATAQKKYGQLQDSASVGPGKEYTASQKKKILGKNFEASTGQLRDDRTGRFLARPQQSKKGVKPRPSEANVDHVQPRRPADPSQPPGANSYRNAEVRARQENIKKSNR